MDLSANTAAYSETPAPLGRPGGPGLWRTKGLKLPDYIENIAKGILKGGVPDESRAIALAIGAVKRWASGGGKVSPEVRAAAAKALAEWEALKAAHVHSHANEDGAAVSLTWNGTEGIDLASVELAAGFNPALHPHVAAGSPAGGQWGPAGTNSGGTAGKTPAQQHALHMAHVNHLQQLVAQGKATPAQKAELARLLKALAGKPKVTKTTVAKPKAVKKATAVKKAAKPKVAKPKAAAKPKAVKKPKVVAPPKVNKKKGTVTYTAGGKKVTVSLHQWHQMHVAHQKATGHANDSGRFLELAFAEALAERVPPGRPEGGQFAPVTAQLGRYDTPDRAARVINAMEPVQRAVVRASTLPPPGYDWRPDDRLASGPA